MACRCPKPCSGWGYDGLEKGEARVGYRPINLAFSRTSFTRWRFGGADKK